MTTLVLLAIIAGETYCLYRLGTFNPIVAWAMAAGACLAGFWENLSSLKDLFS